MPSDALPVQAAARYVGLSVSTLNKLRSRGGGPVFLKLGRRVAYRADDLDEWIVYRRFQSTGDYGVAASKASRT